MTITIPLRVVLEVDSEQQAREKVIQYMNYMKLFEKTMTYNLGHAIIGEYDPSIEKPFGRPK